MNEGRSDVNTVYHHGRETAYRTRGGGATGPGLLCVHGSGGTGDVWSAQSNLARRTPVTSLDLSGHGASDDINAEPGPEALEAYADDIVAVAEATDASVLVGNSLGGAVAMWVALERDLPLDGLVLTGTGAKLTVLDDLLVWLGDDFERAIEFLHQPDRLFHDADKDVLDRSRAAMRDAGRAVVERDFRTCHEFDVRDRLDEIPAPALAVVGEHDGLTPPRYHEYLAEEIPVCDLTVLDGAAHLAMVEQSAAFNDAVEAFLDDL
ncbi:alpha/beta fold hydrolase [Halobaculum gomorrense]|uniref:Pimeloyl-ACP methyl ester carboxylesterase n=1 Tax=Halobaculum gomorrense TaxID=43928 RepID=A0A1M5SAH0_9EURY|nr:alpha/beta hydrolase [Halobaculum gomorrense]SHH35489.1 Pimeloyl-ACP methyl ester carboxylesterase [Halobaculum gomorrense]